MKNLISLTAAALITAAAPAFADDAKPFFGTWNCMSGEFGGSQGMTFDAEGYIQNEGQDKIGYVSMEEMAGDWSIEFKNGFRLALIGLDDDSFTWRSLESGDEQTCKRA